MSLRAADYHVYELKLKDRLREGAKGMLISGAVSYTFYRSLIMFALLTPAAFVIYPELRRNKLAEERRRELKLQFKEAIWILSGFLSAGISVENAFEMTRPELIRIYGEDSMMAEEFGTIIRGISLNKPIEPMLYDLSERSGLEEIQSFAEIFVITRRNGGSLREVIERTVRIIRDEIEVGEEINNLTASRRYEQRIMNLLPFMIIIYINVTSGGFMDVMYESIGGRIVMTVCLGLIGLSYMLSQRILDIRV